LENSGNDAIKNTMVPKNKLILASASKGRLGLLEEAGLKPDLIAAMDVDETPLKNEKPAALVVRLAEIKAKDAHEKHPDAFIIAADTLGAVGTRIIGKAADEDEARAAFKLMSGRRHKVHTGVCVINPEGKLTKRLVSTIVKLKRLSKEEIDWYLAAGEWEGKSGCYSIQGKGSLFMEGINGSYSGIVGLPLCETLKMLKGLGYKLS
jgi:septum formation protein